MSSLASGSLVEALLEAAQRFRRRTAIQPPPQQPGASWNYGELERASRGLAVELEAAGIVAGDRVGVWMRKAPVTVAALWGILRVGASYVPLDPLAPAERIRALAADAQLAGLWADADLLPLARGWAAVPRLLGTPAGGVPETRQCPVFRDRSPAAESCAWVLYTSGSTGVPKGVMLSHGHAWNFVRWAAEEARLRPGDRVSSHAPFHFDLSAFDLWASLISGAQVCLLDAVTVRFPRAVAEWVATSGVNVWYSVPSALVGLEPHLGLCRRAPLREVIFAGEVFPPAALGAWRAALPQARFHNWYGPTETNVCTHHCLEPGVAAPTPLPIGRAVPGFDLEVWDENHAPVGAGETGMLWASGVGVMSGYWGDEARTAAVTWKDGRGRRWYNTGDQARWNASGELEYAGRHDAVVKLRGYRVSLLEVELALSACSGVRQAAVVALPTAAAPEMLVAHVAASGVAPNGSWASGLRQQLRQQLPAYMVPERIELHAALPVTATGKVDRRQLQAADLTLMAPRTAAGA